MIASLLSPSSASSTPPAAQGRISQLLPTVKCSTCHQPVPLAELGEHTCTAPPPVPSLPKPSITPEAATALLPGRLQGRVAGPSSSSSTSTSPPPRMGPSPPAPTPRGQEHQRIPSSASTSRLKINTRAGGGGGTSPTQSSFQPKPSPLARSDSSDTSSPRGKDPAYPFPPSANANANAPQSQQQQSPLRTRMRTPSNSGSISSVRSRTPSTARQQGAFNDPPPPMRNGSPFSNPSMSMRGGPPPPPPMGQGMQPQRTASPAVSLNPNQNNYAPRAPPASAGYINGNTPGGGSNGFPPRPAPPLSAGPFAPNGAPRSMNMTMGAPLPPTIDDRPPAREEAFVPPAERGIDTKTGGAAGMAGVGRRGFAAAARAAMFTVNPMERGTGTPQPYGRMPGGGGFMDYDDISRSTSTPPFSASAAGGSGYASSSSYAPGPLSASPLSQGEPRYPSSTSNNNNNGISNNFNNIKYGSSNRTPSPPTQQQNIPPPKSAMPSLNTNTSSTNTAQAAAAVSPISGRLPFFEKFRGRLPGLGSSSSTDEPQSPEGGDGMTPSASAATITPSTSKPLPARTRTPPPSSPTESESEYGGLAYADSTDYEDNDDDDGAFNSRKSNSSLSRPVGKTTPIPLSLAASLLERSSSGDSANAARKGHRPQFGSVSSRSRSSSRTSSRSGSASLSRERDSGRADIRIGGSGPMTNSVVSRSEASGSEYGDEDEGVGVGLGGSGVRFAGVGARGMSVGNANGNGNGNGIGNGISTPQRKASTGTSDGDDIGRARAGSGSAAAIAQALGLSRTPSRDRKVLGGPAIMGRSLSGASSSSGGGRGVGVGASPSKQRGYGGNPSIDNGRGDASSNSTSNPNSTSNSTTNANANANLRTLDTTAANNRYHRDLDADDEDEDEVLGGMMGGAKARRSRTVQGTQSPEAAKKPIKLPVRSLTSPSPKSTMGVGVGAAGAGLGQGAGGMGGQGLGQKQGQGQGVGGGGGAAIKKETRRRVRTCRKCAKTIEDGRWVSVDGGGVLCERCWKNMYLPKCRRCNLPIEKAAVSSSDGQLKGKYHKECFNCFTCSKPFPDKTFYVYDGKPLCAYHYHEANDSLCAAALCGQPIEGPCAVSHTGDRYHPEHMTCEYPGYPKCGVRLDEYWEVEGRMLCERHASGRGGDGEGGSGEEGDEEWVQSSRAKKRVTRFIDLAGAGGVGGSGLR